VEEALEKAFQNPARLLEPLSELSEHEDHYLLRVEEPGLGPENLEVRLEGDQLGIEGEKRDETRAKHLAEIVDGRIYRAYLLPRDAKKEAWKPASKGRARDQDPREKRPQEYPTSGSR
jgi:HSP20 family protein